VRRRGSSIGGRAVAWLLLVELTVSVTGVVGRFVREERGGDGSAFGWLETVASLAQREERREVGWDERDRDAKSLFSSSLLLDAAQNFM